MAKPKILIVDDDPPVANALGRALREQYEVFIANSGEDALAILNENQIAVIITDQRMPGLTGTQLIEKAKELSPNSVGILISGYTDVPAMIDAINIGQFRGYVPKPFDLDRLRHVVENSVKEYATIFNNKEVLRQVGNALLHAKEEINALRKMMDGLVERQMTDIFIEGTYQSPQNYLYKNVNASEQKKFLSVLSSGVLMLNENGSSYYCNPAFVELLDLPNCDLLNSEDIILLEIPEVKTTPELYDALASVLRGEFVLATIAKTSRDGSLRVFELSCSPIPQVDGSFKAMVLLQDRTQEKQVVSYLTSLQNVTRLGENGSNLESILSNFLVICTEAVSMTGAALFVLSEDEKDGQLLSHNLSPESKSHLERQMRKKFGGKDNENLEKLARVNIAETVVDHPSLSYLWDIPEIKSAVVITTRFPTRFQGIFIVFNAERRDFQEEEISFLNTMLDQIGDILNKNQILSELQNEAHLDPITGLANHRFFTREARKKLLNQKSPITLFMIDVDEFKLFNDRYGHQTGDTILKAIGQVLKNSTRTSDIVARYGGDEFIILMSDCHADMATEIISRIERHLPEIPIPQDQKPAPPLQITLSIGKITTDTENPLLLDEMILKADMDMYRIKKDHREPKYE